MSRPTAQAAPPAAPAAIGYEFVRAGDTIPVPADHAGGVVMRPAPADGVLLARGHDAERAPIFLTVAELERLAAESRERAAVEV